ncbi:MAG: hypothetical protein HN348_23285 [Proteobacteria bacterium]|jgi:hypothetical protein|nr:hypothetical protein [Pseudomonadota bacterium]
MPFFHIFAIACSQDYAQAKAVQQALSWNSWCPRWVDGAPVAYTKRLQEEIVAVQLPDMDDTPDPGPDIRLRDSLPLQPMP